jgi:DNA primase
MNPVEEIKSRLDIVEIISSYINLTPVGGNWKARCPFHNEKTPSFMVSKEKQIWHCFGCDRGGDLIKFVQEYEGLEFKEALKFLAAKANVPLAGFNFAKKENVNILYKINEQAAKFYYNVLEQASPKNQKVLAYLEKRKINKGSQQTWQLGLSGESWDELFKYLCSEGYKEEDIFQAGLIVKKKDGHGYVDRFRKRLMFPIFDSQGRVVAFTSRTLAGIVYEEDDFGGKYINSPQTSIYDKSKILYGWHLAKEQIRRKKYLIIVEGNMDAIAAHQAKTHNTVAVSGTALTLDHIKLIKRYTNNVILAFDGDAAGSQAAFRSVVLGWQNDLNLKVLILTGAKDPADLIKEDPQQWLQAIKDSLPVMDYYVRRILAGVDLTRADHKKIAVQKILPIIKFLKSSVEKAHYLKLVADKLQIPLEILERDLATTKSFLEDKPTIRPLEKTVKKNTELLLSERLLSLAFFKLDYLEKLISQVEPEIMEASLVSLYRKVIIYYTKQQHLDNFIDNSELDNQEKSTWVRLAMAGEKNFLNCRAVDLENDWQNSVFNLKKIFLDKERQILIGQLRQAELNGNRETQDNLSHKINLLNKEINKLQS